VIEPIMTYSQLFAVLQRLGFTEQDGPGDSRKRSRVYVYEPTNTVMLFRAVADQRVSPADLLSTEMRLQSTGISSESLESLSQSLESMQPVRSKNSTNVFRREKRASE
jgi:hypothetical protein